MFGRVGVGLERSFVSVVASVVLFHMWLSGCKVCAHLCLIVCAEFAGSSLCVGCVSVCTGVIGVEQTALYEGCGALVLCPDVRSAGVLPVSIFVFVFVLVLAISC